MKKSFEDMLYELKQKYNDDTVTCYLDGAKENNKDMLLKQKAVVEYCYDYLQYGWAAQVTGIILGCDLRDSKEHADRFLAKCKEIGL